MNIQIFINGALRLRQPYRVENAKAVAQALSQYLPQIVGRLGVVVEDDEGVAHLITEQRR